MKVEPLTIITMCKWEENGDHPLDGSDVVVDSKGREYRSEGNIVRRYRHPQIDGKSSCQYCGKKMCYHGWIDVGHDGWTVCPGDFIVTTDALKGTKASIFPVRCLVEAMVGNKINTTDVTQLTRINKTSTKLVPKPLEDVEGKYKEEKPNALQ